MAGRSEVTNTFTHTVDEFFDASVHTNEKSGDRSHFLFQDKVLVLQTGTQAFDTLFDNGQTFNTVAHTKSVDGQQEVIHFNSHVPDFDLLV
jgi:hypothetical protein